MNRTGIEYLDFTSNPIVGCDMTLPCAEHCWARQMAVRLKAIGLPHYEEVIDDTGNWTGKVSFDEHELQRLLRKKKPATIGLCFMADAFHPSVPDEWLDKMLAVVALTPHIRYILPTKRSKRMREWFGRFEQTSQGFVTPGGVDYEHSNAIFNPERWPLPNLALMLSASNQAELDARIIDFVKTPAALRILSAEPMLEEMDVGPFLSDLEGELEVQMFDGISWVICGGESGPGARPMHPDWVRSLRDQCVSAGVPYFFKQWGDVLPTSLCTMEMIQGGTCVSGGVRVGKKAAGRLLDGKLWDQRPEGWTA